MRGDFGGFLKGLKHLDLRDWGWLHAKIVLGIALPIAVLFTPRSDALRAIVADPVVHSMMGLMLIGGIFCIVGLLFRATRIRPLILGYSLEMGGLVFLFAGPFLLFVVYGVLSSSNPRALTAAILCYALASFALARFFDIRHKALVAKEPGDKRLELE